MITIGRILLCAVALTTTTACQFFSAPQAGISSTASTSDNYHLQQLDAGREHLAAGRTTLAIDSFRLAATNPQLAVKALNGLAISYDRLQRPDLARRYFTQAMALSPNDERITRNLARFEVGQATLQLHLSERKAAVTAAHEFLDQYPLGNVNRSPAAVAAPAQPSPAFRRAREIQLISSVSGISLQRSGDLGSSEGPRVIVAQRVPAAEYPVRIEFNRPTSGGGKQNYPVRIALNSSER